MSARDAVHPGLSSLDARERAVLAEYAKGHGSKAIARQLGMDKFAVDWARKRIAHKTGGPLVRAVVLATKAGWL
jgi:DNA-binding CsgD family transcriptional regulator